MAQKRSSDIFRLGNDAYLCHPQASTTSHDAQQRTQELQEAAIRRHDALCPLLRHGNAIMQSVAGHK